MPSDKSLQAMEATGIFRSYFAAEFIAIEVDRLVAEAVTEERQRILDALGTQGDGISVQTGWVRAIVNGTDQQ